MKVFLIYVRDEDFYRMLPPELGGVESGDGRVKVMAFPPLGIETLAPIVREAGHEVEMFDTCHPEMKQERIAERVVEEQPDVIALSMDLPASMTDVGLTAPSRVAIGEQILGTLPTPTEESISKPQTA